VDKTIECLSAASEESVGRVSHKYIKLFGI
jgi:hypothetical protein